MTSQTVLEKQIARRARRQNAYNIIAELATLDNPSTEIIARAREWVETSVEA